MPEPEVHAPSESIANRPAPESSANVAGGGRGLGAELTGKIRRWQRAWPEAIRYPGRYTAREVYADCRAKPSLDSRSIASAAETPVTWGDSRRVASSVLPQWPERTDGGDGAVLAALVTRNGLIGVASLQTGQEG